MSVELTMAAHFMNKFEKANEGKELSADQALQVIMAYAAIAQAEAMQRIAMHLGNIHQTLITPDANREPTTVADLLKRVANALHVEIRGEQIQITDVLHAIYEALEDRNSKEWTEARTDYADPLN